jgi:lysophospholipase L1-like esterase
VNEVSTIHKIIIGAIVVIAFLLLLENAARIYEPRTQDVFSLYSQFGGDGDHGNFLAAGEKFIRDPELFWRIRPHYKCSYYHAFKHTVVTESTNARSFRGTAEIGPKAKNTFRIVALGDSWTYGVLVADDETYPAQLCRCLNAQHQKDRTFEVLNLGCVGYSSFQGRLLLSKYIDELQPDLVLVCFGGNDARHNRLFADKDQPVIGRKTMIMQDLLHRSALYAILRDQIMKLKARISLRTNDSPSPQTWPMRVPPEDYKNNLEYIVSLSASRNSRTILLTYAGEGPYQEKAREVSSRMGVPLIDIHKILTGNQEYRVAELSVDYPRDPHPNAKGHSLIAAALCDTIRGMTHEKH